MGSQPGSGLLCLTVYMDLKKDSPYRTTGWSWGNSTVLQPKKYGTDNKWRGCQKNNNLSTWTCRWGRDQNFSYHLTCFYKMLVQSHISMLAPKSQTFLENTSNAHSLNTFYDHTLNTLVNLPVNHLCRNNSSILAQKGWCVVEHMQYPRALGIY